MVKLNVIIFQVLVFFMVSCKVDLSNSKENPSDPIPFPVQQKEVLPNSVPKNIKPLMVHIDQDIRVANYFSFLDGLVKKYDSLVPYALSEHVLVRANPWIMDTLANTDYYRQMAKGSFVYDQLKMIVLRNNDS